MRTTRAFTLIEMIVVVGIIMVVMAMLLPGVALMQRKTDLYATANVLQNVHAVQFRNARQFGSAGLVYGYTLMYTSDTPAPGAVRAAGYIKPWIVGAPSLYNDPVDNNLKADIGQQMFWTQLSPSMVWVIEFVDLFRPAGQVKIDPDPTLPTTYSLSSGSSKYLHIAFSPRHGFVMASLDGSPDPSTTLASISNPTATHQSVEIDIWSTKGKTARLYAHIAKTGIIYVDANKH
ncbi:MAG: prepilin-type N-terminal cleavage/methylation domain-containing protein [Planctomycetes bacterium]|nr:prepilin-type N-terminal cleavage/methylation domain-containing protein [Planctomycetota bacterium]